MKNEDRDELLEKINKIKNSEYTTYDEDIDYKDKYSKDIEYMSMELDDAIDRLKRRRAY
jgi:hypothetical protein